MPALNLRIVVPALALLFILLAAGSARNKSLTWDEPTFITAGYTYLDKGDFRLNLEAPPLIQEWVALPLWLGNFEPPDYSHPGWENRAQVAFAKDHTLRNRGRLADFVYWARFPIWVLGGCLVIVGAAFCAQLAGPTAALVFALLAALSPNLLAHGRLATTDLGCAALMFGSVWCFWRAIEERRTVDWIILGVVTGLALLAKYTSLLLGPTFLILTLYELSQDKTHMRSILRGGSVAALPLMATLFLGYDFGFGPALYLNGLNAIYSRFTEGYQFYLMGKVYSEPVWYYHLAAFLMKTPEPTILLLGISSWAVVRFPNLRRPAIYLLTPVVLIVGASFFDKANIGLRRILPAYPFLFAFIALAGSEKPCRFCKVLYIGLVAWAALVSTLAYPHYLSYFNVLSGGLSNGPHLLDDSNLDWGQDLPALAEWQSRNPDEPITLRYFGTAAPELYGVNARKMADLEILFPKTGVYAVSAHILTHFRKLAHQTGRPEVDWLTRYRPFDRAGGSIYLYRFP
jgi:hypothetical protein